MLIIGELLKQADLYISEGLHPTIITEGFDKAKEKALEVQKVVCVDGEFGGVEIFSGNILKGGG